MENVGKDKEKNIRPLTPLTPFNSSNSRNKKMKQKEEVFAAIALALHEFRGNNVHDKESGVITIVPHFTQWNGRALSMTGLPK